MEAPRYFVNRAGDLISGHEVYGSDPGGRMKMHPSFNAQNIWDSETARQAEEEERIVIDHDKHYMQRYDKGDKEPCFSVEFSSLGFVCYWSSLQDGISQWLCGPIRYTAQDIKDPLYEVMETYEHRSFRRKLIMVPRKVCLYLSKLLELAPHMNCGCSECQRRAVHDTCTITVHVDNDKNDPRPLPGAKYLVLTVCNRLRVRDFFCILKGSGERCRADSYFQQIVGSITYPDMCIYGKRHVYGTYKMGDLRMGDLDFVLDFDGGGVMVVMD